MHNDYLLLIHLSDIHFKNFRENKQLDLDKDLRNEINIDLKNYVSTLGDVNAILVGGDIAYSGNEDEYAEATNWLRDICDLVKCSDENILTIPGNHDINRKSIGEFLKTIHDKLKAIRNPQELNNKLGSFLKESESQYLLFKPLENYNNFASKYGCNSSHNPLYWQKDFELNDKSKLRVVGMNSTIVSNDKDDVHNSKLILSSFQTLLSREDGVIYLTLCHHPPQWLYDEDEVNKDLLARAKIQLFGHKHKLIVDEINGCLRLSAGAVHPERIEIDWEPRYNLIGIKVDKQDSKRYLKVKVWKRIWSSEKKKYVADRTENGDEYIEYSLELEDWVNNIIDSKNSDIKTLESNIGEIEIIKNNVSDNLVNPERVLVYKFLSLPYHLKLRVALDLRLVEDADQLLPELIKFQTYFSRAKESNILDKLWDEVEKHQEEKSQINPFINK